MDDPEFSGVPMVEGLFGPQPATKVRGRGRPEVVWDRQKSLRICNLLACGRTVEEVALVVGLSQPTLRRVYFSEVAARKIMALKVKSEQLARLTEAAIGGNVAAEKALAGMIQAEQVRSLSERMTDRQARPDPKPKALGKKEEAQQTALGIGGKFAPPAPPPMLQ